MSQDIYIDYLLEYYAKNGTINDIQVRDEVEHNGEILKIGLFLKNIRSSHKKYKKSNGTRIPTELTMQRYIILERLGINWNIGHLKQPTEVQDEREIRYLREYFKEHGTINDISKDKIVEFEGQKLNIGLYLSKIRYNHSCYLRKKEHQEATSPISLERYRLLDELHIQWSLKKGTVIPEQEEDIRIRYLRQHRKEHGTINDISTNQIVEFEGKTLKIGYFINMVRKQHRKFLDGIDYLGSTSEVAKNRYEIFESLGIIWNIKTRRVQTKGTYDPYIEFLKQHYEEQGTINDLKVRDIVEFNGKKLQIGNFLNKMRNIYAKQTKNPESKISKIMQNRIETLTAMEFIWQIDNSFSYNKLAKEHGISKSTLVANIKKFNGDVDKALKITISRKKTKEQKEKAKKKKYSLRNILDEFDIDIETLLKYLDKEARELERDKGVIKYDENESLRNFCIRNGYNYNIIIRALKEKREQEPDASLEELIEKSKKEYNEYGQQTPVTWVYTKYDDEVLVKHLFLSLGFDYLSILRDMTENDINLDQAFENESFRLNHKDKKYLEGIYHDLISFYRNVNTEENLSEENASQMLIDYVEHIIEEYHLTKEEFQVLNTSFNHYVKAIAEYQLFDVAFENNPTKKVEKIIYYNLDDDDIEETFFIPLRFNDKVLLGKETPLYKRRTLLKNLTVSWNVLSEEERTIKASTYRLTETELDYITSTRKEIDQTKQKVLKR